MKISAALGTLVSTCSTGMMIFCLLMSEDVRFNDGVTGGKVSTRGLQVAVATHGGWLPFMVCLFYLVMRFVWLIGGNRVELWMLMRVWCHEPRVSSEQRPLDSHFSKWGAGTDGAGCRCNHYFASQDPAVARIGAYSMNSILKPGVRFDWGLNIVWRSIYNNL